MTSESHTVAVPGVHRRRKSRVRTQPRRIRRFSAAHVAWSGVLRIMQRVVHYKKSDRREFKLSFSVRDLVSEKSRAVKAQFDALVQAVQKAGHYPAREEAARAVHAVMDAMKDKLPPDVLSRVAESLPLRKGNRVGEEAVGLLSATEQQPSATMSDAVAVEESASDQERVTE